jgi:hypothetical protein
LPVSPEVWQRPRRRERRQRRARAPQAPSPTRAESTRSPCPFWSAGRSLPGSPPTSAP